MHIYIIYIEYSRSIYVFSSKFPKLLIQILQSLTSRWDLIINNIRVVHERNISIINSIDMETYKYPTYSNYLTEIQV